MTWQDWISIYAVGFVIVAFLGSLIALSTQPEHTRKLAARAALASPAWPLILAWAAIMLTRQLLYIAGIRKTP